jgi:uncharacterized membrane protein required for colicin V production
MTSLLNTLKQFNWVDIFVAVFLVRIGYIALKNGLPPELFKLLGALLSLYLGLHYYSRLANFLGKFIGQSRAAFLFRLADTASFVFLAVAAYTVFVLLRLVFCRFIRLEATPRLNRWGGFTLGMWRGSLLCGVVIFALVISPFNYLRASVRDAYLGRRFMNLTIGSYSLLWNSLLSRFACGEKFNEEVLLVQKDTAQ